jgi:hypothetical protein
MNNPNVGFSPTPILQSFLPQPTIGGVPINNIVGSNSAVDAQGELIFYVITTPNQWYIFDRNNTIKAQGNYSSSGRQEFAPREIPIIPHACNTKFDIWINSDLIKYEPTLSSLGSFQRYGITISGQQERFLFGNNLIQGSPSSSRFYTSIAVAKSSNDDMYDLYTFGANNPGGNGNRSLIHCKINPNLYTPMLSPPNNLNIGIVTNFNSINIAGNNFNEYQSNLEVSPNKQFLAYADDTKIYVYNLNGNGSIGSLHSQYNYQPNIDNNYCIAGIEFSANSSTIVFTRFARNTTMTQISEALGAISLASQSISYYSNTQPYAKSEIELGRDGNLYMTSPSGIFIIDPFVHQITPAISSLTFNLNTGYSYTNHNHSIRNLPEQIDGIENSTGLLIYENYQTTANQIWTPTSNPFCSNCNTVYLMGDITINHNIDVQGLNFEILNISPPNMPVQRSKILVSQNRRFRLVNTKLKSNQCSGMWQGIIANNARVDMYPTGFPGTLNMNEISSIEDAIEAINISGTNAHLYLLAANFNKNIQHVIINQMIPTNSYINANNFWHTQPIKEGNLTPNGMGQRSIIINNSNTTQATPPYQITKCSFIGGRIGIQSSKAKLYCEKIICQILA